MLRSQWLLARLGQELTRGISAVARSTASLAVREAQQDLQPVVAIVGSPNVGKSSLFNRLIKSRTALVANTPQSHVTRDYQEGAATLADLRFKVLDTSGLEPFMSDGSIPARATQLTSSVLPRCDVALLLLDARAGVLPADQDLVNWMRARTQSSILLVVNKAERRKANGSAGIEDAMIQAASLGLGEPVAISAETGEGMVDLYTALQPLLDDAAANRSDSSGDAPAEIVKLAVVGVPNAVGSECDILAVLANASSCLNKYQGKSTLSNHLLSRERSLTGPEPGLTRDTVRDSFEYEGLKIELADTAGWLRLAEARKEEDTTRVTAGAQSQTSRAYNACHVAVLVIDAHHAATDKVGLNRKELALATKIISEGRPVIVALNKLDTMAESLRPEIVRQVRYQMELQLPEVEGVPCLGISALTGHGVQALMPTVSRLYSVWNQRIPTARLNKWLVELIDKCKGTGAAAQALRVRYVTQVKSRPPTFAIFVSGKDEFADSSVRMVRNYLREAFGFQGVPLRVLVRYKHHRKASL